ncbi:MAG TPA: sterol desaturase family protein [Puia sp.]|nr:sterol desaturase family protein [Puia sp.]
MKQIIYKPNSWHHCLVCFLIIVSPAIIATWILRNISSAAFHVLLFTAGWFIWTFTEYMYHRFCMHFHDRHQKKRITNSHLYHHHHPSEIKVSLLHRLLIAVIAVGLIILATILENYFTLLTGFYFGLSSFFFMHYFLHQPWSRKIFTTLVVYHIYHHCKYPEQCFGVSVTWWDRIFGTAPPKEAVIPEKIIDFYYNKKHTH